MIDRFIVGARQIIKMVASVLADRPRGRDESLKSTLTLALSLRERGQ
jgi:hypothetical protein